MFENLKDLYGCGFEYNKNKLVLNEEVMENNIFNILTQTCCFNGNFCSGTGDTIYYFIKKVFGIENIMFDVAYELNDAKKYLELFFGTDNEKLRKLLYEKSQNLLDEEYIIESLQSEQMLEKLIVSDGRVQVISKEIWSVYIQTIIEIVYEGSKMTLLSYSKKEVVTYIESKLLFLFFEIKKTNLLNETKMKSVLSQVRKMLNAGSKMESFERADIWRKGNCSFLELIDYENEREITNYAYWFEKLGDLYIKKEEVNEVKKALNEIICKEVEKAKNQNKAGKSIARTNFFNERIYDIKRMLECLMRIGG